MKKIIIVSSIFLLTSCGVFMKNYYHFNRKFSFKNKSAFFHYLKKYKPIDSSHWIYPDSSSYSAFFEILAKDSVSTYLGCFINDSISLKKSGFLKDNQSCSGRISDEIQRNVSLNTYPDSVLNSNINLSAIRFNKLAGNSKFSGISGKKKITIYVVYMYAMGTLYDNLYKEIAEVYQKNIETTDLYIISLDPVQILPD